MKDDSGFEVTQNPNGTYTLREASSGQLMHSRIGPEEEASLLYAEQSEISIHLPIQTKNATLSAPLILFDVGMGTAANAVAALKKAQELAQPRRPLHVYSFETRPEGLQAALDNLERFPFLTDFAEPARCLLQEGIWKDETDRKDGLAGTLDEWHLLKGPLSEKLHLTPAPDIVFYDFYAPSYCPEFWTAECFRQLLEHFRSFARADQSLRLFTYSAATPVRAALLTAGFYVGYGASTPAKRETTVATHQLALLKNPLGQAWLRKLSAHPQLSLLQEHPQFLNVV